MKETNAMKKARKQDALSEINATLGIDLDNATPEQVVKRASEFCTEMADCYEAGTLERSSFEALHVAIDMMRGGK